MPFRTGLIIAASLLLAAGVVGITGCGGSSDGAPASTGAGSPQQLTDRDGDGVPDPFDLCANTPAVLAVDEDGCPFSAEWIPGRFAPASVFRALCVSPRIGIDPLTGYPYPDRTGSVLAENNWLRSWSHDTYLWYDEIVDRDPADYATPKYFALLKTEALTDSGRLKDRFHFSLPTEEWYRLSQTGQVAGYGASFAVVQGSPPRVIVVAYTEPDSPATTYPANLSRGARVLGVDGVDVTNGTDIAAITEGLWPSELGKRHDFVVQDLGATTTRSFSMASAMVTQVPVQDVGSIDTASGTVGYMLFNDHLAASEELLIDAVHDLQSAGIDDLVLDLRYNAGGFLDIASEVAYMIAGPNATSGQTFELVEFNDKHRTFDPVTGQALVPTPFHDTAVGFSAPEGTALPSLDLSRVYILTGSNTCSASEAIINGLIGIDIDVMLVGSATCGKPYGFYPTDNCGTTYFTIQFRAVNAKGFGDYADGFSPSETNPVGDDIVRGCLVSDDFTHSLGDPEEGRFGAALAFRENGACPSETGKLNRDRSQSQIDLSASEAEVRKPLWLTNRIMTP